MAEKGISIWIFSKIVMLVFLFLTFAVVLSYMQMINERVSADSAEALTMQVKNTIQSIMISEALAADLVVPLPDTLPESGYGTETAHGQQVTGRARDYTIHISKTIVGSDSYISIALGWGAYPTPPSDYSYAAASWLMFTSDVDMRVGTNLQDLDYLYINSDDHRFFVVKRKLKGIDNILCLMGCEKIETCQNVVCT